MLFNFLTQFKQFLPSLPTFAMRDIRILNNEESSLFLNEKFPIPAIDKISFQGGQSCNIRLLPSTAEFVNVEVDLKKPENKNNVSFSHSGNTLNFILKQQQSNHSSNNFGNVNIVSGNCVSVVNFSGGNIITSVFDGNQQSKQDTVDIDIHLPQPVNLSINGVINHLKATQELNQVSLNVSGETNIHLENAKSLNASISGNSNINVNQITQSLNLSLSGNVDVNVKDLQGILSMNCSGNVDANVAGTFTSVSINASGNVDTKTSGICKGEYHVNAIGHSDIVHKGKVFGSIQQNAMGGATIKFRH